MSEEGAPLWLLAGPFELHLRMDSDWHVGTGAGRPGDVDRLTARDGAGLPYVPAKTLKGVWREACTNAAIALDNGPRAIPGGWMAWLHWLFGEAAHVARGGDGVARAGALMVRPARLPSGLRKAFSSLEPGSPLWGALTFAKPGVRIDPKSGRAMDDHLRWIEMARGGVTLEAPCVLPRGLSGEQGAAASALLHAGARLFTGVGGGRRRGAGHCAAKIAGTVALDPVWDWLERHEAPPIPATHGTTVPRGSASVPKTPPGGIAAQATVADGPWLSIELRVRLDSPLLVAAQRRGNVTTSAEWIPGGVLLSLLARTLGPELDVPTLLRAGALVVLPGLPEVEGVRGRPVPLAWSVPKERDAPDIRVINRLATAPPAGVAYKGLRGGYLGSVVDGRPIPLVPRTEMVNRMHNRIGGSSSVDAAAGEADASSPPNALFTYVALDAGQSFRAEIRVPQSVGSVVPWDRLAGPNVLGRSKSDDYGAVEIEVVGSAPRPWHPPSAPPRATIGVLTVWVQTAVLLRDARLRPEPSLEGLARVLGEALGVMLRPVDAVSGPAHALRRMRLDDWQVSWGLPRPSLVGIAPGSCAMFSFQGSLDADRWEKALLCGIGERTAEGFGQVVLDDPSITRSELRIAAARSGSDATVGPPLAVDDPYALCLERAAMKERVYRAALRLADDPGHCADALGFGGDHPTSAQVGTLRLVAARLAEDAAAGSDWCAHVRAGADRRQAWGDALLERFERLTAPDHGEVWRLLGIEDLGPGLTPRDPREGLWAAAVLSLVEACARAHQRRLQRARVGGAT